MRNKFILFLLILSFFALPGPAEVLLDVPPLQVGNALLFPDHADPDAFYYIANQPRLAYWPDGTPKLTFLKFTKAGKEEYKGGILHFFVKYGLEEQELAKVRAELAKIKPKAKLKGPIVFKKGSFMVISAAVGEGGVFTRKIIGEGKAPLISGSEVSVSIAVTPEGAAFLEEALRQPTYPVSIRFDMTYEGLTPKYNAAVKISYSKVRNYFEQYQKWKIYKEYKLGFWTWKVKKGEYESHAISDDLVSNGSIIYEVTGEDQNLDTILQTAVDQIMRNMFEIKPELPDEEESSGKGEEKKQEPAKRPYGVSLTRKAVSITEDWQLNFTRRLRLERDTGPMDASIGDIMRKFRNDRRVFNIINLDDPDLQDRTVYAILDGENFDTFQKYINFVTVSFRKNHSSGGATTQDVIFNAKTFAEKGNMLPFIYPRLGEGATWLRYEYKTTWSFIGGIKFESPWTSSEEAAITLYPPHRYREIDIIADDENVKTFNIKLISVVFKNKIFGREKTGEVKIIPIESLLARYQYVHEENDLSYQYEVTWILGDGRKISSGWRTTADPFIYALYQEK